MNKKTDDEIDTSDIAPLEADFFAQGEWQMPQQPLIALSVEADVLNWFKSQDGDFRRRVNAALRIYAEAHKEI